MLNFAWRVNIQLNHYKHTETIWARASMFVQPVQRGFEILSNLVREQFDILQMLTHIFLPVLFTVIQIPVKHSITIHDMVKQTNARVYSCLGLENIQRFFTRKVLYKFDLEYKQRLSVLNLESLEYQRLKTDLEMYYKIIHNLIDLNCEDFFKFSRHLLTRSHNLTLTKPICKTNLYLNSFSNRVINVWNKLPINVVNAPSLPSFVNSIKKIDFSSFLIF